MIRILVVDDDWDCSVSLAFCLSSLGHEVTAAADGAEAVKAATADRPDVIIMDVQMPNMNGDQAARVLRERGFTAPILALTGNATDAVRARCLAAGCDAVLEKPIDPDELLEAMAVALEQRAGV